MASYETWLCTDRGERLKLLEGAAISMALRVNGTGAITIALPYRLERQYMRTDRMLQVWRNYQGRLRAEFVGFLRDWEYMHEDGLLTTWLDGPCVNDLLARRIVAYPAASSQAQTSVTHVDDAMKDLVAENLGASASSARDLTGLNFRVATDLSAGPNVQKAFAWRNVLLVLEDLAAAAEAAGSPVYFGIEPTAFGPNGQPILEFRTWTGQPGRDRRQFVADSPVVFAPEFGNVWDGRLRWLTGDEENYVYAGGGGTEADRVVCEVSTSERVLASAWNRREAFADARNAGDDTDRIDSAGYARLYEGRARVRFQGNLISTPGTPYGAWRLGDRVTVHFEGYTFDVLVGQVAITVGMDGLETIRAACEGELVT